MFRSVIGGVEVARSEHIFQGGDRCVYEIKPEQTSKRDAKTESI